MFFTFRVWHDHTAHPFPTTKSLHIYGYLHLDRGVTCSLVAISYNHRKLNHLLRVHSSFVWRATQNTSSRRGIFFLSIFYSHLFTFYWSTRDNTTYINGVRQKPLICKTEILIKKIESALSVSVVNAINGYQLNTLFLSKVSFSM